ncbi:hypothetical protein V1264_024177 [Littorina saxatilis]|uniref:HTH CENPB-type domain-containing protein n=1 Tax=Littorina saxatilis TaxID=31220 RepID=A0AAN9AMP3_9CAEN
MSKRKRQDRTAEEKLELIDKFKALPSCTMRESAAQLGVNRGFLTNILKNEDSVRKECATQDSQQRKRLRHGKDKDVEDGLFQWFQKMRAKNAPIHGPLLCTKAEELATALGHTEFKPTDGWFSRWKVRIRLEQ